MQTKWLFCMAYEILLDLLWVKTIEKYGQFVVVYNDTGNLSSFTTLIGPCVHYD